MVLKKIYFSNKVNSATRAIENFNSRLGCSIDGDFLLNNIIFFNGKSDYNAMIPVFASLIAETYLYNATKCFSEIIGKPKKYNDRLDIKEYYKIFTEEGEDLKKILNDLDCKCGEDILKISNVRNNVMHGRTIQVSGEVVEKAKNFPDRLLPIYAKLQNYLIEKYSSNI